MKNQDEINEYRKRVEKMKKMIRNKDQNLKEKYIERIVVNFCAKKYKIGAGSERYDKITHQRSLIQYQRLLKMWEKTMEDSIATIQYGGKNKKVVT